MALAGRSEAKLEQTRAQLPQRRQGLAAHRRRLRLTRLARRHGGPDARRLPPRSVPYLKYGEALISAVANAGTDYADLTGEVPFVRWTHRQVRRARRAAPVRASCTPAATTRSRPTSASMRCTARSRPTMPEPSATPRWSWTSSAAACPAGRSTPCASSPIWRATRSSAALLLNPHALSSGPGDVPRSERGAEPSDNPIGKASDVDPSLRGSIAPFVMGSYNTRIVRRSHYLMDKAYGPDFRYAEAMRVGKNAITSRIVAAGVAAGIGALFAGLSMKPTRAVLDRFLPKPGEGPSEEARNNGFFKHKTFTTTSTGARYVATVEAQGDPGYKATAMMLGEAALTLALDRDKLPDRHGILTPASAMGDALTRPPACGRDDDRGRADQLTALRRGTRAPRGSRRCRGRRSRWPRAATRPTCAGTPPGAGSGRRCGPRRAVPSTGRTRRRAHRSSATTRRR